MDRHHLDYRNRNQAAVFPLSQVPEIPQGPTALFWKRGLAPSSENVPLRVMESISEHERQALRWDLGDATA